MDNVFMDLMYWERYIYKKLNSAEFHRILFVLHFRLVIPPCAGNPARFHLAVVEEYSAYDYRVVIALTMRLSSGKTLLVDIWIPGYMRLPHDKG